jgi:putative membrane protein
VGARFLDDEARAAFKQAIEHIENASAVEVVVALRQTSARYVHANVIVGAVLAFAGLAVMLFAKATFSLGSILVDPFVVALLGGGAVELLPAVKRWLTTARVRSHHVTRAARATFVERGVHNTTGRTGMLVYISWLERQIVVVPDSGIPAQALAGLEDELTAAMHTGGAAVARRLENLASRCADCLPHRADDVNELPDALDEGT